MGSNPVIHSYNVIKLIISYRVVQLISNPVIHSYNVIKLIISYPGIQLISYIVIQSYSESVIYSSSFSVIQSSSSPGYHQAIQSSSQPLIKTINKVNHYIFQDIYTHPRLSYINPIKITLEICSYIFFLMSVIHF